MGEVMVTTNTEGNTPPMSTESTNGQAPSRIDVTLPVSGDTIVVRTRVSNRQRKDYMTKMENAPTRDTIIKEPALGPDNKPIVDGNNEVVMRERVVSGATYAGTLDSFDMLLGFVIESWTLTDDNDEPIPVPRESGTLDALDDLDVEDYDHLSEAVQPTVRRMFPRFDGNPADKDSPSAPSSE